MAPASREVRIRSLTPSDHAAFVRLLRLTKMSPKTHGRDGRASFRRQLARNRRWYLGAFDGDRLVGVVLGTHDTRKAWINRLAVHPDHRRRKVASRLVRECERRLRADTGLGMFAAIVELENLASRSLFEGLGYRGWKVWYMRKKRDPGI